MGGFFLLVAGFIWFVFSRNIGKDVQTIFVLTPGGATSTLPDISFNTYSSLNIFSGLCLGMGIYQFILGFKKYTNLILAFVGGILTMSFLAWGAGEGSINVGGMLRVMILRSVPITLGALSGLLSERAGIVNIGIEGMMITGALVAAIAGSVWGLWAGMFAAIIAGGLTAVVHGILSIKYKIDQAISGTIINITTIGLTSYIVTKLL
ncbi:ABC transporter permease, partial [bacterium]|nr:ABC transporter permease [bacterium]